MTSNPEPSPQIQDANSSATEDALLIAKILSEEDLQKSYSVLVEKYWKVVIGWVLPRTQNIQEAEEVAQESFVKAFRALKKLESPKSFLAWLLRIATNQSKDLQRKKKPTVSLNEITDQGITLSLSSDETTPSHKTLETQEDIERVFKVISQIPSKYRMVLTLKYQLDLSAKQIAQKLGEPEGTIRNRIFRALNKVREKLNSNSNSHSNSQDKVQNPSPSERSKSQRTEISLSGEANISRKGGPLADPSLLSPPNLMN